MRLLLRLMLFVILTVVVTPIARKLLGIDQCGDSCSCSDGAESCYCGHATCLAPSEA